MGRIIRSSQPYVELRTGNDAETVYSFDQLEPGDVLVSIDGKIEWEVHSKHDAVTEQLLPRELVTTIRRAEGGTGLAGLEGSIHIMSDTYLDELVRIKRRRE